MSVQVIFLLLPDAFPKTKCRLKLSRTVLLQFNLRWKKHQTAAPFCLLQARFICLRK